MLVRLVNSAKYDEKCTFLAFMCLQCPSCLHLLKPLLLTNSFRWWLTVSCRYPFSGGTSLESDCQQPDTMRVPGCIHLTNRFHVAVHLSNHRSQMKSKCGKNKKVTHEAIAECVIDVVTTFRRLLWYITGEMHGNMESIFLWSKLIGCYK